MNKLIAIPLILQLVSGAADASPEPVQAKTVEPTPQTVRLNLAPAPSRAELEAVYGASSQKLDELKLLIRQSQYGPAYKMALELLSEIKRKTGISPTSKVRERISVQSVLSNSDLKMNFADLQNWQKDAIRKAIGAHKSGYYIELLNLAKMVRVAYLHAFTLAMQHTIRQRDKDKAKRDYLKAHNIEILVQDKNTIDAMMVFDLEVADEDYQWAFNREILEAALKNPILGWSEQEFEKALIADRSSRREEYNKGLRTIKEESVPSDLDCFNSTYSKFYRSMSSSDASRRAKHVCGVSSLHRRNCIRDQYSFMYSSMSSSDAFREATSLCR